MYMYGPRLHCFPLVSIHFSPKDTGSKGGLWRLHFSLGMTSCIASMRSPSSRRSEQGQGEGLLPVSISKHQQTVAVDFSREQRLQSYCSIHDSVHLRGLGKSKLMQCTYTSIACSLWSPILREGLTLLCKGMVHWFTTASRTISIGLGKQTVAIAWAHSTYVSNMRQAIGKTSFVSGYASLAFRAT